MNVSSSKHLLGDYEVLLIGGGGNELKTYAYDKKRRKLVKSSSIVLKLCICLAENFFNPNAKLCNCGLFIDPFAKLSKRLHFPQRGVVKAVKHYFVGLVRFTLQ